MAYQKNESFPQLVYMLYHVDREDEDDEVVRRLGIYSSKKNANMAAHRFRLQPEFASLPKGFQIHKKTIDKNEWTSGFHTIKHREQT